MNILVSGSLAYDRIMTFPGKFSDHILPDKIHILNVCFLVNGLTEKFGGTAGNIAYSLKLLGEDPIILAAAGKDFDAYQAWLDKNGLNSDGIRRIDTDFTAGAYITTDMTDNQITGFNPGAMNHQAQYDLSRHDPAHTLAIVAPGNLADMKELPRAYKKAGIRCILDPGQNIPAFSGQELSEMLDNADILVSNDYELELIQNSTGLTLRQILDKTPTVITTLAENGSVIRARDGETPVPPAKPEAVKDPTGAGDAFRAGLIKGIRLGKPLPEAAKMGSVSAVYAVERHGTQEHAFTWNEFAKRYEDNFGPM